MAEEKDTKQHAQREPGKVAGWLKAVVTSLFGLASGAALMYLTPLVNNVIKPGKPVPNFAQQASGLTVTFNNRSIGGTQGWWDFGDGSALEPFESGKDTITHTYPRPGTYNVKLTLQNLLGEESERVASVFIDNSALPKPVIEAFAVVPVGSSDHVPAVFRVISQVKNAKLVAWDIGGTFKTETNLTTERFVTLQESGYHTFRLVAFNGDQVDEKSQQVVVGVGDSTKPIATLRVIYDGVPIEQKVERQTLVLGWEPKHQGATCPVQRELTVAAGWTIADAKYEPPANHLVRNVKPEVSPDRTKLKVSAELIKPKNLLAGKNVPPPQAGLRVELTLVRRSSPVSRPSDPVMLELNLPGMTALPLPPPPAGLEVQNKRIALEIKDGAAMVWNKEGLPSAAQAMMKNKLMRVSAVEQGAQLRVNIVEATPATPVSLPKN